MADPRTCPWCMGSGKELRKPLGGGLGTWRPCGPCSGTGKLPADQALNHQENR